MFTGIVEELGRVGAHDRAAGRLRITARTVLDRIALGDSIAVNGCCLTVVDHDEAGRVADVSAESYARTSLGGLSPGDPVNLERPVRLVDRLGGHVVQGHVDAVGTVVEPAPDLRVGAPGGVLRYVVEKGSITVDGVSLTVVDLSDDGFTVAVIPHTMDVTTLGSHRAGAAVNLEVDILAKYTERLLTYSEPTSTVREPRDTTP